MAKDRETMIDFDEEISRFQPSLEVEDIGEAIVKSDLTDMSDIVMEVLKQVNQSYDLRQDRKS